MTRNQTMLLIIGTVALLAVQQADAADFKSIRCKGGIVSVGDSKLTVQGKCGPPTMSEMTGASGDSSRVTFSDTWSYDCGKNSLTREFRFRGGRLVGISTGGYGFGDTGCE